MRSTLSLDGPVARQNTLPASGSSQAFSKCTPSSPSIAWSRRWASSSCSSVTPKNPLWTSMNLAMDRLLSRAAWVAVRVAHHGLHGIGHVTYPHTPVARPDRPRGVPRPGRPPADRGRSFGVVRGAAFPGDSEASGGLLLDLASDLRHAAGERPAALGRAMS